MRKAFRKFFLLTIFITLAFTTASCGDNTPKEKLAPIVKTATLTDDYNAGDTWLVYWYLCGSNLETDDGAATMDIQELLNVALPDNVKVLIETGGANQWQNDTISNSAIERYLYSSKGLERLQTLPDADMGDVNTLIDFISYGSQMPADHRVFVFWDHGGGSAAGVCLDERTNHFLDLNSIRNAFTTVHQPSNDNPPFEMIGFDTCLMATYDTINTLDGLTKFMVASEEVEPGYGWNYLGWVGALAQNPAMGGAKLGQAICDTYYSACSEHDTEDAITLSVIDLNQLPELRTAYEAFGLEALKAAYQNPRAFFSNYGRGAINAENYGGNNRQAGYTEMVDLVDLAKGSRNILPKTSDRLINAVENAVVYRINGPYRAKGAGISGFYSYSGQEQYLINYLNQEAAPLPQKILYYYLIYGEIPEEVIPYIEQTEIPETPTPTPTPAPVTIPTTPPAQTQEIFQLSQLEDTPVQMDNNGNAFVHLNAEQMELISSVHCLLYYMGFEDDVILALGSDADINADWESGIFMDNFRGVWPMLDGHPIFVQITAENDGYNLYTIPVKLNGVECNLLVAYVYEDEKYYILGARKGIDNNGMSERDLIKLRAGDEITTLHYGMTISSDDSDLTQVEVDTFTIGDNPEIKDEEIGDGNYGYCFEFVPPTGEETALSKFVLFSVSNGQITTNVDLDN